MTDKQAKENQISRLEQTIALLEKENRDPKAVRKFKKELTKLKKK